MCVITAKTSYSDVLESLQQSTHSNYQLLVRPEGEVDWAELQ